MSWFNKFISLFALTAIMLLGVLAIHSIKVDTLPLDYALGLISKNRNPIFTIKAQAQCSNGPCATEPTLQAFRAQNAAVEAARQAVSSTIGGVINMIKATLKAVMKVLQMIKKVFNFFITLLQKFAGKDISLYGILSAVQDLSKIDGAFKDFKNEWNDIWKGYATDNAQAQQQIAQGQKAFQKAGDIYSACIAVSLMEENGEKPNVDKTALCNLAINSKIAIDNAVQADKIAGAGKTGAVSSVYSVASSSQTIDANGTVTTQTTTTTTAVTMPLVILFGRDPDGGLGKGTSYKAELGEKINQAKQIKDNKDKQAALAREYSLGCGPYVGPAQTAALGVDSTGAATTTTPTLGTTSSVPDFNSTSSTPSIFSNNDKTLALPTITQKDGSTISGPDLVLGAAATGDLNFSFAKVGDFEQKSFTPEQCSNAQNSAKTTEDAINQANSTTQPAETAGGIASVIAALQSIFELISLIQQVFQQVMGFINEIMNIGKSFMSEFAGFFSSIGNIFGQAGAGGSNQAGILAAAINGTSTISGAGAGQGPTGTGQAAVLDDGSITVNDANISANLDNIQKYSDLSIDCVTDNVKTKVVDYTNQYKESASSSINPDALPKIGANNIKTYTNGSNVPDGVMGASVTDSNTPGMSGISYTKSDKTTGAVPATPARSLITSGSATGNINATYHQCQSSPWGDDNSPDTAAKRLAYYPADQKYGGPSAYRDGVSNDWRVVNNVMSKDIPDQCYLTNNDLSQSDKQAIISALGINISVNQNNNQNNNGSASQSAFDQAWQQAKGQVDQAQREGKARWDPDTAIIYQNRVRGGVIVGSGDNRKEVPIKAGKCEISYTQDQVSASLQNRGWSFTTPEVKSFVKLIPGT